MKILVINGPNMQLLGTRCPQIYGHNTLKSVCKRLEKLAKELEVKVECFQSNQEGDIVDKIGLSCKEGFDGIVINPAAYTHTSIAIHDAIQAVGLPAIEVHISNIYKREQFRRHSMTAPACVGVISGLGVEGYEYAFRALIGLIAKKRKNNEN